MILIHVALIVFAVVLTYVGIALIVRRAYYLPDTFDETHYVETSDGWRLAIHRRKPTGDAGGKLPVLLCHGLGANRFNFDMPAPYSFAKYLQARGYDVFLLELRGTGHSIDRRVVNKKRWAFGFNDFVDKDIPAAVDRVIQTTGAPKLHWVGHSMGGMVIYGFAGKNPDAPLASICTIGSPASFDHLKKMAGALKARPLLKPFSVLHTDILIAPFVPLIPHWQPEFITDNYNPRNMPMSAIQHAGANLVAPVSRKLLLDFASFVETGTFLSSDGFNYLDGLSAIRHPIFQIAGSDDKLCRPEAAKIVYDRAASLDKKYRCFGKKFGEREEYGHGDLVMGHHVAEEIFPAIGEWLGAHNG